MERQIFNYHVQFNVALFPYELYENTKLPNFYDFICDLKEESIIIDFFKNNKNYYEIEYTGNNNFHIYFKSSIDYVSIEDLIKDIYEDQEKIIYINDNKYILDINAFAFYQF